MKIGKNDYPENRENALKAYNVHESVVLCNSVMIQRRREEAQYQDKQHPETCAPWRIKRTPREEEAWKVIIETTKPTLQAKIKDLLPAATLLRAKRLIRLLMLRWTLRWDEDAVETLVNACKEELETYISNQFPVLYHQEQQDLMANVLSSFLESLDRWKGGSISAYLKTTARHQFCSDCRYENAKRRIPKKKLVSLDTSFNKDEEDQSAFPQELAGNVTAHESSNPTNPGEDCTDAEALKEVNAFLKTFAIEDAQRWAIIHRIFVCHKSVWKIAKQLGMQARTLVAMLRKWSEILKDRILELGLALPKALVGLEIPVPQYEI